MRRIGLEGAGQSGFNSRLIITHRARRIEARQSRSPLEPREHERASALSAAFCDEDHSRYTRH